MTLREHWRSGHGPIQHRAETVARVDALVQRLAASGRNARADDAYAMLAAGRIDLVVESGLKVWDWSALVPVIEAAGGAVTNWRGETPDGSGQIQAVGDVGIREQALVTLRRASL